MTMIVPVGMGGTGAETGTGAATQLGIVSTTGNQTIAGVKTFSDLFVLPVSFDGFYKTSRFTPAFVKTGAGTISIVAGTRVEIGGAWVTFQTQTAVTMPALTAGEDYAIWCTPTGALQATADPFDTPASPPAVGARKIGGFHYGLTPPGTTVASGSFSTTSPSMIWTQADVDRIAGINEHSIWDIQFRPKCDPRGMSCFRTAQNRGSFWTDIYFTSQNHITFGTSRFNTNVASGTVPPRIPIAFGGNGTTNYSTFTWYEASEVAASHGKRLLSYEEFILIAFGVTENQSLGGASSTIPSTARQPGYTSRIGLEQATGHIWTWGNIAHGVTGTSWVSGAVRGQTFGTPFAALFGGGRDNSGFSGSRCSIWSLSAWGSGWPLGLRASCDHES